MHEVYSQTVRTGVVAERDGLFWGVQYEDGHSTEYGFGPIERANVSDPKYCLKPTDMLYKGHYKWDELALATLRPISITTNYTLM